MVTATAPVCLLCVARVLQRTIPRQHKVVAPTLAALEFKLLVQVLDGHGNAVGHDCSNRSASSPTTSRRLVVASPPRQLSLPFSLQQGAIVRVREQEVERERERKREREREGERERGKERERKRERVCVCG